MKTFALIDVLLRDDPRIVCTVTAPDLASAAARLGGTVRVDTDRSAKDRQRALFSVAEDYTESGAFTPGPGTAKALIDAAIALEPDRFIFDHDGRKGRFRAERLVERFDRLVLGQVLAVPAV